MIAIKFEKGKVISYKYPCEDLEELRPTSEDFTLYDWDGEYEDIPYLIERDGVLMIDIRRKTADKRKRLINNITIQEEEV